MLLSQEWAEYSAVIEEYREIRDRLSVALAAENFQGLDLEDFTRLKDSYLKIVAYGKWDSSLAGSILRNWIGSSEILDSQGEVSGQGSKQQAVEQLFANQEVNKERGLEVLIEELEQDPSQLLLLLQTLEVPYITEILSLIPQEQKVKAKGNGVDRTGILEEGKEVSVTRV